MEKQPDIKKQKFYIREKSQLDQPLQEMSQMFSQAQVSFIAVAKYCFPAHYFSSSFLGSNQTLLSSSRTSINNTSEVNLTSNGSFRRSERKANANKKGKEKDYIGLMQIHYFSLSI